MLVAWLWMGMLFLIPLMVLFSILKYLFGKNANDRGKQEKFETPSPLDILKSSYARGEINRDEFLQKRSDILEK